MKSVHFPVLLAVFIAEFALFRATTVQNHAWAYPRWYDQNQYLNEAYLGYERARDHGFVAGVKETLTNVSPQGALHDFWALLIFTVFGPSRMAALSVNMLAFLLLQAGTFLTVRRLSGSLASAWVSIAILAALRCPWSGGSGSAVDFRLDWMAACGYGIALCAAIAGAGFRSTRWAVIFGVAVGMVVLTRFLTGVYFALIYAALLAILWMQPDRLQRCLRLIFSGVVALGIFGPVLWLNRRAVYSYYWIGHIDGPERALRESHRSVWASFRWVFEQFFFEHVGMATVFLGIGAIALLLAWRAIPALREDQNTAMSPSFRTAWCTTLIFFVIPFAVLSLHPIQAPAPVSILLPAFVWILLLSWLHCARQIRAVAVALTGGIVVPVGAVIFVAAVTRKPATAADAFKVNALADYFYYRAEEVGLREPRLAVTGFSEGFSVSSFQIVGYERHQHWLRFVKMLPVSLFETAPENIMQRLADSDFVCLLNQTDGAGLPSDRQMADMRPQLRQWCETHLRRVKDIEAMGPSVSIYERPGLQRPDGRSAVDLAILLDHVASAPDRTIAIPVAEPLLESSGHQLGSTQSECFYQFAAAYTPVNYRATGLPPGLVLDGRSGNVRGRFSSAGTFTTRLTATNALGSTTAEVTFEVKDQAKFASVEIPQTCIAGSTVSVRYEIFDATGKLNFIDVTDLTAGKTLDRLPAGEGQKQSWRGRYEVTFAQPGHSKILLRIVSYDPAEKPSYSFFDEEREINVTPRVASGIETR